MADTGDTEDSLSVIDYPSFLYDYWPRFSHTITKSLPTALVFAEIMGVIKGSVSSLESLVPLTRNEYVTRSSRLAPTFVSDTERGRVYDVFESYENFKASRGEADDVDRVIKVLKALRHDPSLNRILRSTFDEMYIDGRGGTNAEHVAC